MNSAPRRHTAPNLRITKSSTYDFVIQEFKLARKKHTFKATNEYAENTPNLLCLCVASAGIFMYSAT